MSKRKFYTILNILNVFLLILFFICMLIPAFILVDLYGFSSTNDMILLCGIASYILHIILKLSLFPKWFVILANKHKNSIIGQFAHYLHNNQQDKKKILTLAFVYDIPFLLYFLQGELSFFVLYYMCLAYFLCYMGGVWLFYIMLYRELHKLENTDDIVRL